MENMDDMELDQVTKVIGYHPRFLRHFLRTQNFVMKGDGPLPYDFRYFLAIIAAARHQCPYLVKMYEKEFINHGGSREWLKGIDHIPSKLRAIYEINKILAHRPWLLRKAHIESLTKGIHNWSLSEVVHAIVLLSHFHALSSFVFSCGLVQKLDSLSSPKLKTPLTTIPQTLPVQNELPVHMQQTQQQKNVLSEITMNKTFNQSSSNNVGGRVSAASAELGAVSSAMNGGSKSLDSEQNPSQVQSPLEPNQFQATQSSPQQQSNQKESCQTTASVETIMERMKVLSEKQNECSEAELSNRFKNVEMQTAELSTPATELSVEVPPIISHYIEDPSFTYEDFAKRGSENIPSTFRIQDYSWDDHGYSLVNDLYSDVGTLLDDKFRAAYNLTYFTMGGRKNVDTSKFRRAIWNYIQCIYGIRHDDYDYGEVNQLLDRPLKMFIKTACCFPERITTKDYDSILVELLDSEKVHVNLMIMEARNQAELLYALREIMRYMT